MPVYTVSADLKGHGYALSTRLLATDHSPGRDSCHPIIDWVASPDP